MGKRGLGSAAAVIGGEMLLHDVERGIERHVERDIVPHERMTQHRYHHRRCMCGHEFAVNIEICPRCRRRWGSW